ncbi:MAG: chemotaxis protein CheW [Polyangiaceae bacterium]
MNSVTKHVGRESQESTQYLSFSLAGEEYAVEILRVQEIRGICPITPLPQTPSHVRGVMNLRGAVVPVIDLRLALGLPETAYGKFTVIVVLSVRGRTIGFVVDSVSDVLSLDASSMEGAPDLGSRIDENLVRGIARTQDRFVMLLDVERVSGVDALDDVRS